MERVSVACKLPNGLKLRLCKSVEMDEPVMMGGTQKVTRHIIDPSKGEYTLHGVATRLDGEKPLHLIIGGAAITTGIPKDFIEEWLKQNEGHPAVVNRMIFTTGTGKQDAVVREAKNLREEKSNQGPMDPRGDKRVPKSRMQVKPATKTDDDLGDDE